MNLIRCLCLFLLVLLTESIALGGTQRPMTLTIDASGTTTNETITFGPGECAVGLHMDSDWTAANINATCDNGADSDYQTVTDSTDTTWAITGPDSNDYVDLTLGGNMLCGCMRAKLVSDQTQTNAQTMVLIIAGQ